MNLLHEFIIDYYKNDKINLYFGLILFVVLPLDKEFKEVM
jgi:hypothetical protein